MSMFFRSVQVLGSQGHEVFDSIVLEGFVVSAPGSTPTISMLAGYLNRVCYVLHFALLIFLPER